jgi:Uma2 family endonuclease
MDGKVLERSLPAYQHGEIQPILAMLYAGLCRREVVFVSSAVRLALDSERLYRIPDFCAYEGSRPADCYPPVPPMLAVEIFSPDDRLTQTLQKLEHYWHWGVENIWLIDPDKRKLDPYDSAGLHPVSVQSLPKQSLPKYAPPITLADLALA